MRDDETVYVPTRPLQESGGNPPKWHPVEDCQMLQRTNGGVTELPLAEAKEKCSRKASCCSAIPTLEDADPDEVFG